MSATTLPSTSVSALSEPELVVGLGWLQKARLDPTGRMLATCSDTTLHIWYLNGTLASKLAAPSGLVIAGCEWSPNGSLIALSDCLGQIKILEAPRLTTVRRLEYRYDPFLFAPTDPGATPWPMAWSPNGSLLAIAWWDDQVHIFDARTGEHISWYQASDFPTPVHHLGFGSNVEWFPDGKHIISGMLGTRLQVHDLSSGEMLEIEGTLGTRSRDGRMVAAIDRDPSLWGRDSAVVYWAGNGTQAATIQIGRIDREGGCGEWSPDDSIVALGAADGRLVLWRWGSGEVVANVSAHQGSIISLSWEGSCLVSASRDHEVKVWTVDLDSGKLWLDRSFTGWGPGVKSVAWYPDGAQLAACRGGRQTDCIEVYAVDGSSILQIGPAWNSSSCGSALSPDGRMIAGVANRYQVSIWDAQFGTLSTRLDLHQEVTTLEWCPGQEGVLALGGSAGVEIRDVTRTGAPLLAYLPMGEDVFSTAWSPDGEMLAIGLRFEVGVWDPWTPMLLARADRGQMHGIQVLSLSWSPDGSKLACLAESRTEQDPVNGTPTSCTGRRYLANVTVWEVYRSPDPLGDGRVTLVQVGSAVAPPIPGASFSPDRLAGSMDWAPNSTCLAAGTGIWSVEVGGLVSRLNLTVPVRPVSCVSWSPDGSRIVVGSLDGSIKLWRVGPLGEIPEWPCPVPLVIMVSILHGLLRLGISREPPLTDARASAMYTRTC